MATATAIAAVGMNSGYRAMCKTTMRARAPQKGLNAQQFDQKWRSWRWLLGYFVLVGLAVVAAAVFV